MQKALIISYNPISSSPDLTNKIDELNKLLDEEWKVIHSCSMPSSVSMGGYHYPTCLIIVEKTTKEGKDKNGS